MGEGKIRKLGKEQRVSTGSLSCIAGRSLPFLVLADKRGKGENTIGENLDNSISRHHLRGRGSEKDEEAGSENL